MAAQYFVWADLIRILLWIGCVLQCAQNTFAHFTRRFVGKGECHNVERINIFALDQMSDAVSKHACFARAGAGNEHTGSIGIQHPLTLGFIQAV